MKTLQILLRHRLRPMRARSAWRPLCSSTFSPDMDSSPYEALADRWKAFEKDMAEVRTKKDGPLRWTPPNYKNEAFLMLQNNQRNFRPGTENVRSQNTRKSVENETHQSAFQSTNSAIQVKNPIAALKEGLRKNLIDANQYNSLLEIFSGKALTIDDTRKLPLTVPLENSSKGISQVGEMPIVKIPLHETPSRDMHSSVETKKTELAAMDVSQIRKETDKSDNIVEAAPIEVKVEKKTIHGGEESSSNVESKESNPSLKSTPSVLPNKDPNQDKPGKKLPKLNHSIRDKKHSSSTQKPRKTAPKKQNKKKSQLPRPDKIITTSKTTSDHLAETVKNKNSTSNDPAPIITKIKTPSLDQAVSVEIKKQVQTEKASTEVKKVIESQSSQPREVVTPSKEDIEEESFPVTVPRKHIREATFFNKQKYDDLRKYIAEAEIELRTQKQMFNNQRMELKKRLKKLKLNPLTAIEKNYIKTHPLVHSGNRTKTLGTVKKTADSEAKDNTNLITSQIADGNNSELSDPISPQINEEVDSSSKFIESENQLKKLNMAESQMNPVKKVIPKGNQIKYLEQQNVNTSEDNPAEDTHSVKEIPQETPQEINTTNISSRKKFLKQSGENLQSIDSDTKKITRNLKDTPDNRVVPSKNVESGTSDIKEEHGYYEPNLEGNRKEIIPKLNRQKQINKNSKYYDLENIQSDITNESNKLRPKLPLKSQTYLINTKSNLIETKPKGGRVQAGIHDRNLQSHKSKESKAYYHEGNLGKVETGRNPQSLVPLLHPTEVIPEENKKTMNFQNATEDKVRYLRENKTNRLISYSYPKKISALDQLKADLHLRFMNRNIFPKNQMENESRAQARTLNKPGKLQLNNSRNDQSYFPTNPFIRSKNQPTLPTRNNKKLLFKSKEYNANTLLEPPTISNHGRTHNKVEEMAKTHSEEKNLAKSNTIDWVYEANRYSSSQARSKSGINKLKSFLLTKTNLDNQGPKDEPEKVTRQNEKHLQDYSKVRPNSEQIKNEDVKAADVPLTKTIKIHRYDPSVNESTIVVETRVQDPTPQSAKYVKSQADNQLDKEGLPTFNRKPYMAELNETEIVSSLIPNEIKYKSNNDMSSPTRARIVKGLTRRLSNNSFDAVNSEILKTFSSRGKEIVSVSKHFREGKRQRAISSHRSEYPHDDTNKQHSRNPFEDPFHQTTNSAYQTNHFNSTELQMSNGMSDSSLEQSARETKPAQLSLRQNSTRWKRSYSTLLSDPKLKSETSLSQDSLDIKLSPLTDGKTNVSKNINAIDEIGKSSTQELISENQGYPPSTNQDPNSIAIESSKIKTNYVHQPTSTDQNVSVFQEPMTKHDSDSKAAAPSPISSQTFNKSDATLLDMQNTAERKERFESNSGFRSLSFSPSFEGSHPENSWDQNEDFKPDKYSNRTSKLINLSRIKLPSKNDFFSLKPRKVDPLKVPKLLKIGKKEFSNSGYRRSIPVSFNIKSLDSLFKVDESTHFPGLPISKWKSPPKEKPMFVASIPESTT